MGVVRPMSLRDLKSGHQVGYNEVLRANDSTISHYRTGRVMKLLTGKGRPVKEGENVELVSIRPTSAKGHVRVSVNQLCHRIYRRRYYPIQESPVAWPPVKWTGKGSGYERVSVRAVVA